MQNLMKWYIKLTKGAVLWFEKIFEKIDKHLTKIKKMRQKTEVNKSGG